MVVGSSAGGVEAVTELLGGLAADFAAPIVIAQHLNPSRRSHLEEILRRRSPLPVRIAASGDRLEPGTVYIVPADRDVEIEGDRFALHEPRERRRPVPSIDLLLRSAARAVGPGLAAVILSGSGSDGAAGAADVKAAGGLVIIQDPESAAFPSMPRSLALSVVDAVAEPRAIGPVLGRFLAGEFVAAIGDHEPRVRLLLAELRQRSGIDFGAYKQGTVQRRLEARMTAAGRSGLADYLRLLEDDPEEYGRLAASLLINVTEFFRDAKVMAYLRSHILPEIVAHARASGELRIWCAGCATGEEGYTVAMLVLEALGEARQGIDLRIFATDVDTAALAVARRGVYPAAAIRNVPAAHLRRYFEPRGDGYEVTQEVRDLLIFGEHDLGQRPPFPHLDLVLCRNVLIYFTAELQRRVLQVFAYALREGGWLVLGKSESAAIVSDAFVAQPEVGKVYRREGPAHFPPPPLPTAGLAADARRVRIGRPPRPVARGRGEGPVRAAPEEVEPILLAVPIGVVTVGPRYETNRLNPAARRLLGIHGVAHGEDFIHLAEGLPAGPLRTALKEALKGVTTTTVHPSLTADGATGQPRQLEVTCAPLRVGPTGAPTGALVVVVDVTAKVAAQETVVALRDRLDQAVSTSERLLAANTDVTSVNDQLRAENQMLTLGAEDAQAAREEAETLTEELQASNEELETLNEELQASVEELNVSNDDLALRTSELAVEQQELARERDRMAVILEGMSDAVVAVDSDGRPVMANRAYRELFGDPEDPFVPEDDAGRPLSPEAGPFELARRGEAFDLEFSLAGSDGERRWFEARGSRLQYPLAAWAGVVVIRDVSERSLRRLQTAFLAAAAHEVRTPIAALHGYVQLLARRLDPADDEQAAAYAASALAQTRHLGELSDRLFDLSLVTQRGLHLEREPVDLIALCRRIAEIQDVLAGESAAVTVEARRKRLVVQADPGRIEQVLFNLVANALLHGAAQHVVVRVRSTGPWAEVAVQDDGRGIPAVEMPRLFGRHAEVGHEQRNTRSGLGLGLFLAHEIVAAHEGTISATSHEGVGTTVTLRLPWTAASGPA